MKTCYLFRSSDGSMLVASSSDGYCTIVHFKEGELGVPCSLSIKQVLERSNSPLLQSSDTSGTFHIKPHALGRMRFWSQQVE